MNRILSLLQAALVFGTVILFGAMGEILTEKSGNLNLGVPGIMYLGGIAGLAGCVLVRNERRGAGSAARAFDRACVRAGGFAVRPGSSTASSPSRCAPTRTSPGLTLTIFGSGVANLFGGAMNKMAGGVGQISVSATSGAYRATLPFLSNVGVFSSLGFMVYLAIAPGVRPELVPEQNPQGPEPPRRRRKPGHGGRRGHQRDRSINTCPPASARRSRALAGCTT